MQPVDPILSQFEGIDAFVIAVVDGALADGLAELRADPGALAYPLYKDLRTGHGNPFGPWLMPCEDAAEIAHLRNLLPASAVVWWLWPGDSLASAAEGLFHHLRKLGMAELPVARPGSNLRTGPQVEPVLFRHADAEVLVDLLPVLTLPQRARFYGRARGLVLDAPRRGGLRRALVPPDLPLPAPGLLRLTPEQCAALAGRRGRFREDVIVDYLHRNAPEESQFLGEEDLRRLARAADRRARALGIRESPGMLMLAYLAVMTGGAALHAPEIELAVTRSGLSGDDAIAELMAEFARAAAADGRL